MKTAHYIIVDHGDGSQGVEWYKGTDWTAEQLIEYAEKDEYDSYQSGDGVQLTTIQFPDSLNLDDIVGIFWKDEPPGC
jgi:hypothetical protein